MSKQPKEHCTYVNESGERCKAYQAKGTAYCYGHARKLGVIEAPVAVQRPVVDLPLAEEIPAFSQPITVDEPEALKALRSLTAQIELGGGVDPVLATQIANILRPYFSLPTMDGIELATHIDARIAADEQAAAALRNKLQLIENSQQLIIENPNPQDVERVEAKVNRDIQDAANSYRSRLEMTKRALANEPRVAVSSTGQEEMYVVNGVRIIVPAEGIWSVPKTIAQLHQDRLRARKEKSARSQLMQSVPEYGQVYQKMAEIDRQFGTRSQLGGGPQQEEGDYLVAEEIK